MMRTIRRSIAPWVLIVLPILVLAACSSSGSTLSNVGSAVNGEGAPAGGVPEAAASAAAAAPGTGGLGGATGGDGGGDGVGALDDAKIVRTGTIDLQVSDVPKALVAAREGIRTMGGYIGASRTQNDGDRPIASVTYRIPVDRWEDALDLLGSLGGLTTKVVSMQTDAVEVTSQVVDLEARIRNLRASETALQDIAARAVKISDVLEVQAQLSQVRGEIESMTAQLNDLNDRAALATLTASFAVPVVAVEVAKQDWDPGAVVDEATASLVDVLQGLATAGIWFGIVWLPILLVIGLGVGIVAFVARRVSGRGARRPGDPAAAG
jgi:hypothetical protein